MKASRNSYWIGEKRLLLANFFVLQELSSEGSRQEFGAVVFLQCSPERCFFLKKRNASACSGQRTDNLDTRKRQCTFILARTVGIVGGRIPMTVGASETDGQM